jgi:hypothetical protein
MRVATAPFPTKKFCGEENEAYRGVRNARVLASVVDHAHEMAVPAVVLGQLCVHERGGL